MLGTTIFILFIMLVAAANLCLGFAAAVALGVGPQAWPLAAQISAAPHAEEHSAHVHASEPAHEEPLPDESACETTTPPPQVRLTVPDEVAKTPTPVPVTIDSLLVQLSRGFDLFEAELGDWDHRRREGEVDVDQLTNAAIELHSLASGYVDQFQNYIAQLDQFGAHDLTAVAAQNSIRQAANDLAAQLRTATAELGSLQFESGDDAAACAKLTTTLSQVSTALRAAREQLEEPLTALFRCESDLTNIAPIFIENSQASLLGRICFEHSWLTGPSCVAMLDVDQMQSLQLAHAPQTVRKLLGAVAETARSVIPIGTPVPCLAGHQFVICLNDSSPEVAVELVETIRQQIEHSLFTIGDVEIRLTISAAVVSALPDESSSDALQRLRATSREAKTYGRNRTFLCEQQTPVPVVPPQLEVQSQVVAL